MVPALAAGRGARDREHGALAYAHVWSYAGPEVRRPSELRLAGPLQAADGLVLDLAVSAALTPST
jgi:hypothetical protein